jgi:cobalt-zinc-cadmium efflux system membrane fusion protein
MKFLRIILIVVLVAAGAFAAMKILNLNAPASQEMHGEGAPAEDAVSGPHGGRLLIDGDLGIEVTIYEPDIPPQSRVYPFMNGEPLDPDKVDLVLELDRFGDRVDTIRYSKEGDYLIGDRIVEEPHSFDVKVTATVNGKTSEWTYPSYEGRVVMESAAITSSEIEIEEVGPATLRSMVEMHGKIVANPDKVAHVSPRFPGIVLEARKTLGDTVEKGEVVAVVESNDSLRPYEIKSQIGGRVIQRDAVLGESVSQETTLYVIADLSSVQVELAAPGEDFAKLREDQTVVIHAADGQSADAKISYLSPIGTQDTQTGVARAELPNPDMTWQPGLFVTAEAVVASREVPIAVKDSALQTFRDWDVVFMNDGNSFEIAIVELGQRDGEWVEVLSGPLKPGTKYATQNSFVVKADVLKDGASHDH